MIDVIILPMSQLPFSKPQPADPIPLEDWLGDTDRAEVGREPFFCGRDEEYQVFRNSATRLKNGRIGGGTMIFQGAPGAGKTALMNECMAAVRWHSKPDEPWLSVYLDAETLESPLDVAAKIIREANSESTRLAKLSSRNLSTKLERIIEIGQRVYREIFERGFGVGGISIGARKNDNQQAKAYAQSIFESASELLRNFHIVVFVDEAQTMPVNSATQGVMKCLQNPPEKIPLVAAFFGLGNTKFILAECGLSRLARDRVVSLGALSTDDTINAIQAVFDAYCFTGAAQSKWVDALAQLSHGWPHHIKNVSVAAGQVIHDNGGKMNDDLLKQAVGRGRQLMRDYYGTILSRCSGEPWVYKEIALRANKRKGILSMSEILDVARNAQSEQAEPIKDFLNNALHAGVISEASHLAKHYQVLIPSFSEYLRSLDVRAPRDD